MAEGRVTIQSVNQPADNRHQDERSQSEENQNHSFRHSLITGHERIPVMREVSDLGDQLNRATKSAIDAEHHCKLCLRNRSAARPKTIFDSVVGLEPSYSQLSDDDPQGWFEYFICY